MQQLALHEEQNTFKQIKKLTDTFEDTERVAFHNRTKWLETARPTQVEPVGDWHTWLILAGRGWGKTRTGAENILTYAMMNPNVICGVVAPTSGDLRRVCFEGPSGLSRLVARECLLDTEKAYNKSAMEIKLWNGSIIQGYAAIEPDRLRGPQFHRIWADELAAWRYPETFNQMMFGLRLGSDPKLVITTTPRPTKLIKDLVRSKGVKVTSGSTFDNADNLSQQAIDTLREKYENTRLGRQELLGEILEDFEGALWNYAMFDRNRMEEAPELQRIVVAIDPAVTSGEEADETGIVVAGRGMDNRFYVLEDATLRGSPDKWMRRAVDLYYLYKADRIIAEVYNGGDLVERLLRTIDRSVSYKKVTASRGKLVRAEPVAALYEQQKVSHVGLFTSLEDQLCTYTGGSKSPDRLDALVWAITELSTSSGNVYWRVN